MGRQSRVGSPIMDGAWGDAYQSKSFATTGRAPHLAPFGSPVGVLDLLGDFLIEIFFRLHLTSELVGAMVVDARHGFPVSSLMLLYRRWRADVAPFLGFFWGRGSFFGGSALAQRAGGGTRVRSGSARRASDDRPLVVVANEVSLLAALLAVLLRNSVRWPPNERVCHSACSLHYYIHI